MEEFHLHACMGESCYCRPENKGRVYWTDDDKARLMEFLSKMARRERDRIAAEIGRVKEVVERGSRQSDTRFTISQED